MSNGNLLTLVVFAGRGKDDSETTHPARTPKDNNSPHSGDSGISNRVAISLLTSAFMHVPVLLLILFMSSLPSCQQRSNPPVAQAGEEKPRQQGNNGEQ